MEGYALRLMFALANSGGVYGAMPEKVAEGLYTAKKMEIPNILGGRVMIVPPQYVSRQKSLC
jgi:hypothetical protein